MNPSPTRSSISIVVPVHEGGGKFERCLRSLEAIVQAPDEVIVVGDEEGDGSWRKAAEHGFRGLKLEPKGGPGHARNLGASMAAGDWILFLDADVEASAELLDVTHRLIAEPPGADGFIGSYDDTPGEPDFLSQYKNLFHHFVHQQAGREASTFWAGCGLLRKSAFAAVGGFDGDRYHEPSIEDIELGYRLRAHGFRLRHAPTLLVKHWKKWEPANLIRTDLWQRAVPWTRLMLEYGNLATDLNVTRKAKGSLVSSYLVLLSLGTIAVFPGCGLLAAVASFSLFLALNVDLLKFLRRRRGSRFALKATFWRFVHDMTSGLGFILGGVQHLFAGAPRVAPTPTLKARP